MFLIVHYETSGTNLTVTGRISLIIGKLLWSNVSISQIAFRTTNISTSTCFVPMLFQTLAPACGKFAPFEIKEHMSLAPLCRVQCADSVLEDLDRCLLNPSNNLNGLKDWIGQKPRHSGPTKRRRTDPLRWDWTLGISSLEVCIFTRLTLWFD